MSDARATALSNFPEVVREAGGHPDELLVAAGIDPALVGRPDAHIPLGRAVAVLETAATSTATPDLGRRLARRQGIEILGPVGVAAQSARTVADALSIFEEFVTIHSSGIGFTVSGATATGNCQLTYEIVDPEVPVTPQHAELALGVILRVVHQLISELYRPVLVLLPHEPLVPVSDYVHYFGCPVRFSAPVIAMTIREIDLRRPLAQDEVAHRVAVGYLHSLLATDPGAVTATRALIRQLLPTGRVSLVLVATQLRMHPKTLQRRLAESGLTFAAMVDGIRRDTARRLLRDTTMPVARVAHELGYADQSVLTRSCRRWFGAGPTAYRKRRTTG
ncbi:AraC family transcriptional regulator [Gordonia sp. UBA5067]|jgi:AraC-like DNA-binding protein|uniref:AraC family transcriptional regulator n=1 Tax=Gordonia sp. UBA5067 TaxID=1946575 RepID=UPI0025C6D8F3|nr:AraC family transcriptional regulator [Gordonia sp. UBA5067]